MSLCLSTDFAKGSNVCAAGGTVVEGRAAKVEAIGVMFFDAFPLANMTQCDRKRTAEADGRGHGEER
jgi:hypothetical protein